MLGFKQHNISHTSASSINMYAEAPDVWVAKYILKAKFGFSPAARAGVLAEEAVVNVLARGMTEEDALARAMEKFNRGTLFNRSDKATARGEGIPGMVSQALGELKQYGEPEFGEDGKQKKVEINCRISDWTIPVIGYIDLWYPQHGLVVDLKTSLKMPSEMSRSHFRQHGIYKACMNNHAVKFLYVTPKKANWFEPEDTSETLTEIKAILRRQDQFLQIGDANTLRAIVPVGNSYYWSDDAALRRELYGY